MSYRRLFYEIFSVHLIAWWRNTLLGQAPFMDMFVANTLSWYAVRPARAAVAVEIVPTWVRWRKFTWQDIGLGNQNFWRNFAIAFGSVVVLCLTIVTLRGTHLWASNPLGYEVRSLIVITAFVNVIGQQLPVFGSLHGLGMKYWNPAAMFGLAWCSFFLEHFIGSPLPMVLVAAVIGFFFGELLWRTKNLGAGLLVHFSFYFMLAILGFSI